MLETSTSFGDLYYLSQEKKLSEDNVKDLSNDLQKMTDEYMKKIDSIYKQKEKVNIGLEMVSIFTMNFKFIS